jgi:hypothetical protein
MDQEGFSVSEVAGINSEKMLQIDAVRAQSIAT